MSWLLLSVSAACFAGVSWFAWEGRLGLPAIGLLLVSVAAFWAARRGMEVTTRKRVDLVAKIVFTIAGFVALGRHRIEGEGGERLPLIEAMTRYLGEVDPGPFFAFAALAMSVKLLGVLLSATGWHLMLLGQGIRFPFWRFTVTSFLIGRFIGTFLPSTVGLDGYTLYEAARYSGQGPRAVTAKAAEKLLGLTGRAPGFLVALPFGYPVLHGVMDSVGQGERTPLLVGVVATVLVLVVIGVAAMLLFPGLPQRLVHGIAARAQGLGGPAARVAGTLDRLATAIGAYRGKVGLLSVAYVAKGLSSFCTWTVYYLTGLAIGVTGLAFWPVVFGSGIQEVGTLFSPTIAGEGVREALQALLLSAQYGGPAQAVLAGALGFVAAEAATLWGGLFLYTRTDSWRPASCEVDGAQVDYAWLAEGGAGVGVPDPRAG
ncbi:MAG: flippase-like domain-containing protein [Alphaproteobacteria bacterium]|nr:flippase-like domain-containing protein [Alphaproteobacteria bacterium]